MDTWDLLTPRAGEVLCHWVRHMVWTGLVEKSRLWGGCLLWFMSPTFKSAIRFAAQFFLFLYPTKYIYSTFANQKYFIYVSKTCVIYCLIIIIQIENILVARNYFPKSTTTTTIARVAQVVSSGPTWIKHTG